jgi:hypothetical protein
VHVVFVCLSVATWPIVCGVRCEHAVEYRNNGRTDGQTACWVAFYLGQKELRRVKF